ncbi:energy transducer TonB [Niabella drilacis]|uniref:Antitoxin component YwqK of the YwqJK toxin-antitoxin module n=1 Tax=Niabella drilacis (strain DSM 25811 / CCM 8410 / CCUG 62505 / LMG 26954 / E90) TaxID=1285928 RepID=A0A1G6QAY1_NIADE|nr:energy transducer TonB [Niabella drilacis]SDC88836.1 Antitoxin component YwqK of the YwqJK toxin-antitoxin module [Niabella drilacis]
MKPILPLLLILAAVQFSSAQKVEKYFDYRWKECAPVNARYYSLTIKTDSGWTRKDYYINERKLQMKGLYADEDCKIKNGFFTYFYPDGDIEHTGKFLDDKREGLWLGYARNQQLTDSSVYKTGQVTGTSLKWNSAGQLTDSLVLSPDGSGTRLSRFANGRISSSGKLSAGEKQNGAWTYYHRNGTKSSVEEYREGALVNRKYFSELGKPVSDTANTERTASFPGGNAAWQNYLVSRLVMPPNYKIENSDRAIVVVDFIVDEEGRIEDAFTSVPFHPAFDKIALDIIKASPKWNPATDAHNRKAKAYRRQPVNFVQVRR